MLLVAGSFLDARGPLRDEPKGLHIDPVDVPFEEVLDVLTPIELRHEVAQAAKLKARRIGAHLDRLLPARTGAHVGDPKEGAALGAVQGCPRGDLRDVRERMGGPPGHGAVRVDRAVDETLVTQLQPSVVALRDLAQPLDQQQVFRDQLHVLPVLLGQALGSFGQRFLVHLRLPGFGELLRDPAPLLQHLGDVLARAGIEDHMLDRRVGTVLAVVDLRQLARLRVDVPGLRVRHVRVLQQLGPGARMPERFLAALRHVPRPEGLHHALEDVVALARQFGVELGRALLVEGEAVALLLGQDPRGVVFEAHRVLRVRQVLAEVVGVGQELVEDLAGHLHVLLAVLQHLLVELGPDVALALAVVALGLAHPVTPRLQRVGTVELAREFPTAQQRVVGVLDVGVQQAGQDQRVKHSLAVVLEPRVQHLQHGQVVLDPVMEHQ
ncbi:hypothetical protein 10RS306A_gene4596 [Ralstonia phage 10RS306A]|uniref:Uncharacterized protein n=1 Tax=Ralstonia phage 10RS306A TaxID=2968818 RepID=A0A977TEG5_9CAUD|nr:hypothetical protein 10RS306A_gene4596 [Ralstonia phage 10RS306A]